MSENKQKLTATHILIIVLIPIVILLFCNYSVFKSNLVCSSYSICKITEQNIFRRTIKEKSVNLNTISNFYVSSSVDIFHLWKYLNASSSDQARINRRQLLKYNIYSTTKNGERQKFFLASSDDKYKAEKIARELNNILKNPDSNINIKIQY